MNSSLQSCPNLESLPSLTYDQLKSYSLTTSNSTKDSSSFLPSCNSFLLQPSLPETSQNNPEGKRLRDSLPVSSSKKGKTSFGPITKLATELFDSDSNKILGFRCFRECEILGNQLESQDLIHTEIDDDVSSETEDVMNGIDFLLEELESVLVTL